MDRRDPPYAGSERELLIDWLEFQRETLAKKCAGLTPAQLAEHVAAPSTLSLARVLRHLADMEHLDVQILTGATVASRYESAAGADTASETDTDGEGDSEPDDGMYDWSLYDVDDDPVAVWSEECERLRAVVATKDLDERAPGDYAVLTVRSILLSLLMEYARHNGHADLLRERIDGSVGY